MSAETIRSLDEEAKRWVPTSREKPPVGVPVLTVGPGGAVQPLIFDRFWWMPDRIMYVYYEPVAWKRP